VALEQVTLQILYSSSAKRHSPFSHSHLSSGAGKIGLFAAAVQRDAVAPLFKN
jgi:hypothetical protein